jgi:restriction system protein
MSNVAIFLILFALFCFVMALVTSHKSYRAGEAAHKFIREQAPVFARRRAQLLYTDPYGIEQTGKWDKEKLHIVSKVIPDHLSRAGHPQYAIQHATRENFWSGRSPLLAAIERAALAANPSDLDISNVATGIEYETYCAEALRRAGWNARLTTVTGDQGTDIVAERDGKRVVVQCKFYSKPVGNKAVQEVAAARLHERADQAIVVSNADYTKSARQLARTTGVLLLHHDDLASFDSKRALHASSGGDSVILSDVNDGSSLTPETRVTESRGPWGARRR